MTYREEAEAALRAGQNAEIGDPNPYNGKSLALAKCWQRGYKTMLAIRSAATPARQKYLEGRQDPADET
ncbi:hypothetical protein SEA_PAITO_5 [Mycobacterium phage Paito]|uniref:Uncharacterized protein n=1 Tax=Mycobacterium phage Paito TaxID=2315544 RepID=A0A386KGZ4_9CAUD|nr:hypothetical protein KDW68_gp05 [Mycobacterium phage Paito]AYD84590.1 hypothetical protein SEA_PAITO_5 [Mycobacterium phage Paito]